MPAMDCIVKSKVVAPSMVLIPADIASIAVVRAAICAALRDNGWGEDASNRVVLAASEAVANAVEHGSQEGELVEIVYQVGDEDTQVRVLDSGGTSPWTPPAEPPTPPSTATRGRGLAIIRALAQKVEFRPAGHGTELRLDFSRAA
jgi:anti-sigma regulatory factor (Ser/Thr protein kinase)